MVELKYFERTDFKQLIDWIESLQLLIQSGGLLFSYPLTDLVSKVVYFQERLCFLKKMSNFLVKIFKAMVLEIDY